MNADGSAGFSLIIQQSGTTTGAAVTLNCSTGMTCGLSGGVVSLSSAVPANPQINVDSSLAAPQGAGLLIPGTSLNAGAVYYEASGGLTAAKADASTTLPGVCIAITTTACVFSGVYRFNGSQSWTAGNLIYVSDSSAGALTATEPSTSGHFIQRVGVALANDTLLIMPSLDVGGIQ